MKRLKVINNLLKNKEFTTKIHIYMSYKEYSSGYDPYEDSDYTYSNLNPVTIKGYVREISAESLVWRQIGVQETGAVEVICDERYRKYFTLANKIVIDSDIYEVYKSNVGNRASIQKRPFKLIRVVLSKK